MENNWYDVAVAYGLTHRIISVVDWVVDGSIDNPTLSAANTSFPWAHESGDPNPRLPALYRVDTSMSSQTPLFERIDTPESPIGWHGVVAHSENVPLETRNKPVTSATNATLGNNVFAFSNWTSQVYSPEGALNISSDERQMARLEFNFTYKTQVRTILAIHHPVTHIDIDAQDLNGNQDMVGAMSFINASLTQIFYTVNMVHDLFYA